MRRINLPGCSDVPDMTLEGKAIYIVAVIYHDGITTDQIEFTIN